MESRGIKKGVHVITNITPLPGIEFHPPTQEILERVEARKRRALDLAGEIKTKDPEETLEILKGIAADHGEGKSGRSICYHDTAIEWKMTSSTIISVMSDVKESKILYCKGNPCQNEFLDYSYLLK